MDGRGGPYSEATDLRLVADSELVDLFQAL
jgi:hypothetical protein